MEIFFTKEKQWLEKWDEFVKTNKNSSHLILTDWLQSYKSYGFDFEICICLEDGKIIGGYGAVIAKMFFFKFYNIPHGPIFKDRNSLILNDILSFISKRAEKLKCCYCQFNLLNVDNSFFNQESQSIFEDNKFKKGNLFKYVYSSNGLNWLDFKKYNSTEDIISDFKSSVRRDIRNAERKEQIITYATTESEIKTAYELCIENAEKGNYAIRDWNGFKRTILELIQKGNGKFITAYKDNEIKGAIFILKAGNYYTYIFGGTKKEKPDLLTGHLLQWEAIKLSFSESCSGYNISLGGSKGVQDFKSGFNTEVLLFENSKYYKIMNPFLFKIFIISEKQIKPYKNRIAKIVSFIKK